MKYSNAAKGISKIYIAEILSILGAVPAIIIAILAAANHVDTSLSGEAAAQTLKSANIGTAVVILGIVMIAAMLVSFILNLSGILDASKDEAGFKRALWALFASMAFGIIASILKSSNPRVSNWLQVPSTLFELVVTIYVLEGIGTLADNLGKKQISDMSRDCRTWLISALVLSAAAEILVSLGSTGSVLNTTSGIAAALLQIIAYVVYLRVLSKARHM